MRTRILAIDDTFDGMTGNRPYHRAIPREVALKELPKNAGSQFDPGPGQLFCTVIEEDILSP